MKKFFAFFAAVLFAGSMMATTVSKTVEDLATANSWENGTVVTPFALDDVITVSIAATDANSGKYYSNGQQIRLYQTGSAALTLTAADGYAISSVKLTYASQNTGIFVEAESGVAVAFDNVQAATFTVGNSGDATNGQARVTAFEVVYDAAGVTPPQPVGCNWEAIEFLGNGTGNAAYDNRFKVCAGDPAPLSIVNLQAPGWATEPGIYVTFPSAAFGAISLEAGQYSIDGAGMILHISAFLYDAEKEVTIVCQDVTYTLTVLNANPETIPVVLPDPTNCAEAAEAALSVSANNELYNNGAVYSITGYVTAIQTAYSSQHNNVSFWMADAADGGNVIQAYRAACATAEDAPVVGDKVTVTGSLTKYNTTPEFAAGCTFVIVEHTTVLPVNLGEKTIAEFIELANTLDTCVITGVVANIKKNTDGSYNKYGNFDLVDGEASVYVYGLLTAAGEAQKFQEMGVDEGDTLTVKAVYSLYNDAVQAKNAVFVAVKKAAVVPGEEINVTISSLTTPGQAFYVDVVAYYGYWDFYAYNDEYEVEVSNISTTAAEGTYTIDELDAEYTYILPAEGDTIHFTAGQVVLSITDGVVNLAGQLTGEDGNIYNINLTYKDPVVEQTVNVTIAEGVLYDAYADYGLYVVYGTAADNTYVRLAIWAEAGFEGEFTEDDLDNQYVGSGLLDAAGNTQQIFTAAITVTPGAIEGAYTITADLLCYNNTLYKVTMKIGEEQGIDNVDAAVKAFKSIINGQMIIEKNNVRYNANGTVVR